MKIIFKNFFIITTLLSYFLILLTWAFELQYDDGYFGSLFFFLVYALSFVRFAVMYLFSETALGNIYDGGDIFVDILSSVLLALFLDWVIRMLHKKILSVIVYLRTRG